MISFPNAKINLGLNVIRKRSDGFHDIQTVMLPVPLTDCMEILPDGSFPAGKVEYVRSGLPISGDPGTDLVMRAVRMFAARAPLPGLRIHLHKVIPMGAGLGGGSSDGANTLELLNRLSGATLPPDELAAMALELGSDCPFFLQNRPVIATGRGERLQPVALDLKGFWLVIVNPGVHVGTAEVYTNTRSTGAEWRTPAIFQRSDITRWRERFPNVMEQYVFAQYPRVREVHERMAAAGALHSAMSGSGSTVFGLFESEPVGMEWPADHHCWSFEL